MFKLAKFRFHNKNEKGVKVYDTSVVFSVAKEVLRIELTSNKCEGLNGSLSSNVHTESLNSRDFFLSKPFKLAAWKKKIILFDGDSQAEFKFRSNEDKLGAEAVLDDVYFKNFVTSAFDVRTDGYSAQQYFQFYSYISQQQNMLSDRVRTESYQVAIMKNYLDFNGKVVIDVGTGTGVLAFFAVFAGAKIVYAIEASSMAKHAQKLVDHNGLGDKIKIVNMKVEQIGCLPPADVIISEPMGYMLFNERMLESYLHARKWLKPDGRMYPTVADFCIAPFSDESIYNEMFNKTCFWCQPSFFGINMTGILQEAVNEYFGQPIVDTFDSRILLSHPSVTRYNFLEISERDLREINISHNFEVQSCAVLHGFAMWFSVGFFGSQFHIMLSTAPDRPLTHWYQVRLLLAQPLNVIAGDVVTLKLHMEGNQRQSYDIRLSACSQRNPDRVSEGKYDLKNCYFRYFGPVYNSPPIAPVVMSQPAPPDDGQTQKASPIV